MRKRILIAAALIGLSLAAPARAQTSPTGLDEAKALTQKAEVEYKLGHFDVALSRYTAAYEKYPTPALLLNIGQCHRMMKNYEKAVFSYKAYLRDKPDAPNRAVVEGLIQETTKSLEAQQAETLEWERQKRLAEEQARAAAQAAQTTAQTATSTPAAPAQPSPVLRIAGIATAGAGIAAIGTAIALGAISSSDASSITSAAQAAQASHGTTPWTAANASTYSQGQTFATVATALYIGGGVAVAAGGVLTWLGWPKKTSEAVPTPSAFAVPGGGGVVLSGTF